MKCVYAQTAIRPINQIRKYEKDFTGPCQKMTRLAIEEIPYYRLCTYEMDRKETSVLLSDNGVF